MKILFISDEEQNELWNGWNEKEREAFSDISLIISAGDLNAGYLEFLVTMLNVPLLYVRGNHDSQYDEKAPEGCIDIDDKVAEVEIGPDGCARVMRVQGSSLRDSILSLFSRRAKAGPGSRVLRIAGLGGSMRYGTGKDMYTEKEMAYRVRKLMRCIMHSQPMGKEKAVCFIGGPPSDKAGGKLDILVTHAPCRGHGDMKDMPHRGFECFNRFLETIVPAYHCYGHVHMSYGMFERETVHPSGTKEINVCGKYILE